MRVLGNWIWLYRLKLALNVCEVWADIKVSIVQHITMKAVPYANLCTTS